MTKTLKKILVGFLTAGMLTIAAAPASADLIFTCTDSGGCQLPAPEALWFAGDHELTLWEVLIGNLDWHWGGPNSELAGGGTWSMTWDAGAGEGMLTLLFNSGYVFGDTSSRTFEFSSGTFGSARDSGSWFVPEPDALVVLVIALLGFAMTRRRRR